MLIAAARAAARTWVFERAAHMPGFSGAFFSGSTTGKSGLRELSAFSDVDVVVVLSGSPTPSKPGKLLFHGVMVEVTFLPSAQLDDIDSVARSYFLAPSFAGDELIADPTGRLALIRDRIAPHFSCRGAVERRYDDVLHTIETRLRALDAAAPWHEHVTAWMFPTSLTTQVVTVAGLRTPTVRLRYLDARDVLRQFGQGARYDVILRLLGCADCRPETVQRHLDRLIGVFDVATEVAVTPFFFSRDITADARHIAVGASQQLIHDGDHREAVFWIIATFARCLQILAADAAPMRFSEADAWFRSAVHELLGLRDPAGLRHRTLAVRAFLPELRVCAAAIADEVASPCDGEAVHS